MAQGIIAGGTCYENQSLTDITEDIQYWMDYSKELSDEINSVVDELKQSAFCSKIPFEYKSVMYGISRICKANAEDLGRILKFIEAHMLLHDHVDLLFKVGKRAIENSEDNRKAYRSHDECWHDYDDPDFRKVESIYVKFGDYCATLWDATNAATRLRDYVDVPKGVTTMKIEDNSIHIGDNTKIKKSNFHSNNTTNKVVNTKETTEEKIKWQIIVPIIVGVIIAAIAFALGIN